MAEALTGFLKSLDDRVERILNACTACGDCVSVCPTPQGAGIDTTDPKVIVLGILDILRNGDEGLAASRQWATACCGTGMCLTSCSHGINPRFMLSMACRAMKEKTPEGDRRVAGKEAFKAMTRGVRVLSRLQLAPELLKRLSPSSHPTLTESPDLIFYTGCNMLKTPHIGLLCLDVLDRLDIRYEVHGGPANCCGILQLRAGDTANAGRQGFKTIGRFAQTNAKEILSWCPTCHILFEETHLPSSQAEFETEPSFAMTMFAVYLSRHLDELRPMMANPVTKRVALCEFSVAEEVTQGVVAILSCIPGLEIVDLEMDRIAYTLVATRSMPEYGKRMLAKMLHAAEDVGVTTLAGIYHSDHRELSAHEDAWPYEIINFMELIGESMGITRPDLFKRLKLMQDVDAIVAASQEYIDENDLNPEEVREIVLKDLLGEQFLPVDRSQHPT